MDKSFDSSSLRIFFLDVFLVSKDILIDDDDSPILDPHSRFVSPPPKQRRENIIFYILAVPRNTLYYTNCVKLPPSIPFVIW